MPIDNPLGELEKLREECLRRLAAARAAGGPAAIQEVRHDVLGRSRGRLTAFLKNLKEIPAEHRPLAGARANQIKQELESALAAAEAEASAAAASSARLDVTLPGVPAAPGTVHPLTIIRMEVEAIFLEMGYRVEDGPEAESDYLNFTALNIPADHPARDMQDTFYLQGGGLLRTHTSPVQIRTMLKTSPPLKIICPGRAYRRDASDATHSPIFHQVEGLAVDERIGLADLKGTLLEMSRRLFGERVRVRLRPSYFPFVEPGAEFDVSCFVCDGRGCRTCKRSGWIEMGGAGMVHPAVFEEVGYDAERWTGFAFGFGLDRLAMVRFDIDDIRLLFENDLRLLEQFRGGA
ncbi:MAG TPA: phenylalanine--tRNA ligase subunit alpha [Candidatus Polarisedimenticolia bacterium]|nr:phenylalanine--tRNA ligase subunit alpha [Candidatus Polarisedimenticolia bacterium]